MADIKKMFVHFNGTKTQFEALSNKTDYNNSIVFINGGTDGSECIYTHGMYFADIKGLETALASLKYFDSVDVNGSKYTLSKEGAATLSFKSTSPQVITLGVNDGAISFGIDASFVADHNYVVTNLGKSDAAAGTATAFARIKSLEKTISDLTGGDIEDGGIAGMISAAIKDVTGELGDATYKTIEALDEKVVAIDSSVSAHDTFINGLATEVSMTDSNDPLAVVVKTQNGAVTSVEVDSSAFYTSKDVDDNFYNKTQFDASILDAKSAEDTDNRIKVSVTTQKGVVTGVNVDASAFRTESEVNTQISTAIDKLAGSKTSDVNNGIKVSVSTSKGEVSGVTVDATALKSALDTSFAGKADLGADGKIVSTQLPDYILGQVLFGGTIDANGNIAPSDNFIAKYGTVSTLPTATGYEGAYFIATADGTAKGVTYNTGDWVISTGKAWEKIDNTDAVASVAGLTGTITATALAKALAETGDANELALKSELNGVAGDVSTNAAAIANLDSSVKGLETSVSNLVKKDASIDASITALINKDASLDASITALINKDASLDASIAKLDSSVKGLETSVSNLVKKDASLDASITALINKDASLDASITALINKDASLDSSISKVAGDIKDVSTALNDFKLLMGWEEINA